ncbi:MAG: glucosamine-6-phosphate deaminase [Planctomycetota bacterium]
MLNPVQKYKADMLKIHVCQSVEAMAEAAAAEAQKFLRAAIAIKGRAAAILATGNSQLVFLEKLIALTGIDWERVTLFHMDEYLGIPADHPASFRKYMKEKVADKINPRAFHYLRGDALEPISECLRYEALITTTGIDLVCMGIGENGHIAFNDPPVANFNDEEGVKIVKLDDACRKQQVGEGHFPTLDAVPQYALTLTIPALVNADRILCIVPEKRKAQAVKAALHGPIVKDCPASILRREKQATLFLDQDSSSFVDFSLLSPVIDPVRTSGIVAQPTEPPKPNR